MLKGLTPIQMVMKVSSDGGNIPTEIQIIPYGHHTTDKGDFVLDEEAMAAVMADLAGMENDMVIDYEHQTLYGGEAPAAGWIKKLVNKGSEGLWAVVEWTERAAGYLANKEYRYLSPVFLKRKSDGHVTRLINAALTNAPAIDGMVALVNKAAFGRKEPTEVSEMKELFKLLGLAPDATEEMAMKAVQELQAGAVLVAHKDVLVALGLKEDVSLEDAVAGVVAMKADAEGLAGIRKDLGLEDSATASEVSGTVMAMKQGAGQEGEAAARLAAVEAKLAKGDAEGLVAQALKDGKISVAMKDWAIDYATKDAVAFKVFMDKAPQVVPLGEKIPGGGPAGGSGGFDSPEEAIIAKQLNVTPERLKKYGPGAGEEAA